MQIVIDIDEKIYNEYMNLATGRIPIYKACDIAWVLKNGTVLPKGHGRLKDVDHYIKMQWEHPDYSLMDDEPTIIEADKKGDIYAD